MNKEPINPVTFRGVPSNISMSRIWLGIETVPDGQHHFSSQAKAGTWEKSMQFVIWQNPEEPLGFMYLDDEAEFIKAIKVARTGKMVALKGADKRDGNIRTLQIITSDGASFGGISFRMTDENDKPLAILFVEVSHFDRGIGHLFVNGELDLKE